MTEFCLYLFVPRISVRPSSSSTGPDGVSVPVSVRQWLPGLLLVAHPGAHRIPREAPAQTARQVRVCLVGQDQPLKQHERRGKELMNLFWVSFNSVLMFAKYMVIVNLWQIYPDIMRTIHI